MKRTIFSVLFSAWDVLWIRLNMALSTLISHASLRWQGCPPGRHFRTTGRCYFKARRAGSIRIGSRVRLLAAHRSNRVGLSGPVVVETLGLGEISIGEFSGGSAVVLSAKEGITIGKRVNLGGNVRIYDHDFHALDPVQRFTHPEPDAAASAPVTLEDDVFVGVNALILKGVRIGAGAVVGAGSVVTCDIPPGEIWAGNPARRVGRVQPR